MRIRKKKKKNFWEWQFSEDILFFNSILTGYCRLFILCHQLMWIPWKITNVFRITLEIVFGPWKKKIYFYGNNQMTFTFIMKYKRADCRYCIAFDTLANSFGMKYCWEYSTKMCRNKMTNLKRHKQMNNNCFVFFYCFYWALFHHLSLFSYDISLITFVILFIGVTQTKKKIEESRE